MAPHLIGYARVSTDEQALHGYGLDAQETKLRDYGRLHSVEITVVREEGVSGKSLERPALTRALRKIANREADGLVATKLDRLSRSAIDFLMLMEWFDVAKAQLVVLDFNLDTGTPSGRFVATILSAMAEMERSLIAQRTREGLAAAKAQGRTIGRPGVGDRPELAARIRGMRENGLTLQSICDALNAEGVPTARGAAGWRPSAVQSILGYERRPRPKKIANLPELTGRR